MYKLKSNNVSVEIDQTTMELRSIKLKDQEYTYQHTNDWKKNWPILFPICGTLKDNKFTHKDQEFSLPRHGFFRDLKDWKITDKSNEHVVFTTTSDKKFLNVYPFEFRIDFTVKIAEDSVQTIFKVKNLSKEEMYFSFGYHPAFLVKQDGVLKFSSKEIFHTDNEKMLYLKKNPKTKFDFTEVKIKDIDFKGSQFYWTDNLQSDFVEYTDDEKSFKINLKEFPVCLLWAEENNRDYICIEPWFGTADSDQRVDNKISNKDNILTLGVDEEWSNTFVMELK
ncbi:hypothetical protein [Spiroplasma alleghenense]|uniref:Aldose 1-epimerase family protein n=1 Tax=Spiroplasma alleghenense TaxID=216931 RepID=A0A345Z4B9_9MOLU|nr:hypothetical protein [Spiroplasma alleghenense]AXK51448.1 aldose 1-epimerase family protein [Spiroplasma alleghenense]